MPNILAILQKNSFNAKGESFTMKAVRCCTDRGKMELIWHFLVNFKFQNLKNIFYKQEIKFMNT